MEIKDSAGLQVPPTILNDDAARKSYVDGLVGPIIAPAYYSGLITLTFNSTPPASTWLTYRQDLVNKRILFSSKTRLKHFSWINSNVNLANFNFIFYKNGQLVGDIIHTYLSVPAEQVIGYGIYTFPVILNFNAGDSMFVQYNRLVVGTIISDLALVISVESIL